MKSESSSDVVCVCDEWVIESEGVGVAVGRGGPAQPQLSPLLAQLSRAGRSSVPAWPCSLGEWGGRGSEGEWSRHSH